MKRWQRYLSEFTLIFLAISAGFFAENLREAYNEKRQIREYASMLLTETKVDTAFMARQKVLLETKINEVDSLLYFLSEQGAKRFGPQLYTYNSRLYNRLIPVDMKAFVMEYIDIRLFKNIDLVNTLFACKDDLDTYQNHRASIIKLADDLMIIVMELFDAGKFNSDAEQHAAGILLSTNPVLLNRYHHTLYLLRKKLNEELDLIKNRTEIAEELMALLKSEYGLKSK